MFENIGVAHSQALDDILKARHTVREFSRIPSHKEYVEQIIRAGLIAPYASFPAAGKTDFRKVFILPSTSPMIKNVENIINDRMTKFAANMENEVGTVPFVEIIKQLSSSSLASLLNGAPYLIIAGERAGIPPIAVESLSYCMQTMWLKATSLKVGFRPVTIVEHLRLGDDDEFC
ncbi:MAG: nitroreductase family protein [Halobacteriota archaeon]